jgi:D-alanine transaminase
LRPHRFPRGDGVLLGIRAVTHPELRWARCDLKTTMLLGSVLAKRAAAARGASEAIFVGPDGTVHEGASSNVFVVERGRVSTPPQSAQVLPGVTRPIVMALAAKAGLTVEEVPLSHDRLQRADEVSTLDQPDRDTDRLPDGAPIGWAPVGSCRARAPDALRARAG